MSGRQGGRGGKVLLPPINFIFRLLQQQIPCSIWLYEQLSMRIEGKIRVTRFLPSLDNSADISKGFDEFMNLVVADAVEVYTDKSERRPLGFFPALDGIQHVVDAPQVQFYSRGTTSPSSRCCRSDISIEPSLQLQDIESYMAFEMAAYSRNRHARGLDLILVASQYPTIPDDQAVHLEVGAITRHPLLFWEHLLGQSKTH